MARPAGKEADPMRSAHFVVNHHPGLALAKPALMNDVTRRLQREAERIAAKHPLPEFYRRFKASIALSRKLYFHHPLVGHLRKRVQPILKEDLGHGLYHSRRVSLDCATLICVELESLQAGQRSLERLMLLGLISGLLHDVRRSEEKHAEAGAAEAARVLKDFPLSKGEVDCICVAIGNHEAFTAPCPCKRTPFQLVSDCLYDADKFRWGPDTFTHTLWHMSSHQGLSPQELIERFPWGMRGVLRILDTFRTPTGRQFGPEIIETGLGIGKEIYRYLLQHYGEHANGQ